MYKTPWIPRQWYQIPLSVLSSILLISTHLLEHVAIIFLSYPPPGGGGQRRKPMQPKFVVKCIFLA